jgi:hypothetical protein
MLASQKLLEILECKSSHEGHISQEPIFLPCGFSVCKLCFKQILKCTKCNEEHKMDKEVMEVNYFVKDLIKNNLAELNKRKRKQEIEIERIKSNSKISCLLVGKNVDFPLFKFKNC